jgi:cytochrome c553
MKQGSLKSLVATLAFVAGGVLASSAMAADLNNGKALVEKGNCASCHGANLKTPIAPAYPKIAGQHADYLYNALKAYQVTNNPQIGRANAVMAGQVKSFNKSELQDMAAYIASLPGDFVVKK